MKKPSLFWSNKHQKKTIETFVLETQVLWGVDLFSKKFKYDVKLDIILPVTNTYVLLRLNFWANCVCVCMCTVYNIK